MEQPFYLKDHLCFSIYACSRSISRMYQPLLNQLGLTYPQYLVLLVLWEKGECSVKQLGQMLDLDSGTLTPLLKRVESKGLILRNRSREDERKVTVRLTDQGSALQEKAQCIPDALLRSSGMLPEELQKLNQSMKLLNQHVSQYHKSIPQKE
ncbi:MarR family transcriptional regulator [Sporolactobacillus sp. CPB3-1]|uniref:HTH-type transcriptional regulator SarZ n=1 Tax=Sporolactobacillus mangiferae TaxID=2940498 RepID=A0ABT0M686_9BACL|nr:MarR family transcriptional regulator [Sporolactobacillus mangiferae]MCL1630361.1 MarR family transcriptional regulator [Sporolactobacillus mangiferae]